jgi:uncharacterized protein (DUF58 family)
VPESPAGLSTLGRCLIAAGLASAVCAVLLDERDLLRIGAFAVTLPLFAAVMAKASRRAVTARRTVSPTRISVGGQTQVELHLGNQGRPGRRLPGWVTSVRRGGHWVVGRWLSNGRLALTDAAPDALGESTRLTVTLARGISGALTRVTYPITPEVRGRHHIGPLTARFSDPLGMAEYERDLAGRSALLVLPRVTPLRGLPAGLGRGEGESGSTGLRRGPGERDALVRQYQPGDPLRTVHWRSTARRDELMVRLEERPWHGGVTVLIDRRTHAHRGIGKHSSLEWAIEVVASVCIHLISRGRKVTLIGEDGVVLATGRDPDALLDSLALLRPTVQPGLVPGIRDEEELFAVIGSVDPGGVYSMARQYAGGYAHAVLLDTQCWDPSALSVPVTGPGRDVIASSHVLDEAGWTVMVGTPNRRPDDIWEEFCRKLPVRLGTGR